MHEPTNPVLIQRLTPMNFLSFGPDNPGIELQALNLLIGPNGSGKSNLIEAINLMRATPRDVRDVTRKGGGVAEWIWKGRPKDAASLECLVAYPTDIQSIRHRLSFHSEAQFFKIVDELVDGDGPPLCYEFRNGKPRLTSPAFLDPRSDLLDHVQVDRSILSQIRDPNRYPELEWLTQNYERIRIYREWSFGRNAVFREPQKADMRNDTLEEDFSNLGLFLNRLKTRFPVAKRAILEGLKDLYDGINDLDVFIEGGSVQVFFTEADFSIPATRLSDGTLRYLCLLAILCDPEPPPLICIEEPELGLHPDILPTVANLLRAASQRTQLIVTTHSDILVDAMTETPEAVIVCSKEQGKTTMERLDPEGLREWLSKYRLGELWIKGEIGGTRW